MKLSQSIIKDVINGCCKYFFQLRYVENVKTEPSKVMFDGLYFESELIGSSREGKIEYPLLKTGKISKAQEDIDKVIVLAKKVLKNSGIEIENVQLEIQDENYIGHVDFMSDKIYEVKFTGETYDRWHKSFIYELYETMDIQARHYQKIERNKKDAAFLIFSAHGWFRYILFPYYDEAIEKHDERIELTKERIKNLDEPTANKCAMCRYNEICTNRIMKFDIEDINNLILL